MLAVGRRRQSRSAINDGRFHTSRPGCGVCWTLGSRASASARSLPRRPLLVGERCCCATPDRARSGCLSASTSGIIGRTSGVILASTSMLLARSGTVADRDKFAGSGANWLSRPAALGLIAPRDPRRCRSSAERGSDLRCGANPPPRRWCGRSRPCRLGHPHRRTGAAAPSRPCRSNARSG